MNDFVADAEISRESGSLGDFDDLVSSQFLRVLGRSRGSVGECSVHDVAQETFLQAYRSYSSLADRSKAPAWLKVIHRRTLGHYLRKRNNSKTRPQTSVTVVDEELDRRSFEQYQHNLSLDRLRDAWIVFRETISEADYRLLCEVFRDGCSVAAIANREGVTDGAIRVRIHRLKKLAYHHLERDL